MSSAVLLSQHSWVKLSQPKKRLMYNQRDYIPYSLEIEGVYFYTKLNSVKVRVCHPFRV